MVTTSTVVRRGLSAIAAVVVTLAMVAGSWAQAMFYREVAKDGRIYVFASAQRFEAFDKGADTGPVITRAGYGPSKETVVFDSEDAVNYYNFKHDIPGEVFAKPKPEAASPFPSGKITGLVFGDLYYFPAHHDPKWESQQGFWVRRVYLGYDYSFTDRMSARLRLEMNSNGTLAGGTLVPFVKDAFFAWKFKGAHTARFGLQPSLSFDSEETFWGLRHVEKTPVDLYVIDAARDLGIGVFGPIGTGGLSYGAVFGNDAGNGGETDKYKVGRLLGLYEPPSGLRIEGLFMYGKRAGGQDRTTAKAAVGIRKTAFRANLQYVWQERKSGTAAPDTTISLWSGFGVWEFRPKRASVFARVDSVSADQGGADVGLPGADTIPYLGLSNGAPFKAYITGLDLWKGAVHMSPNLEIFDYDGASLDSDVVTRLTFFWSW
jgi:hypothetical protein